VAQPASAVVATCRDLLSERGGDRYGVRIAGLPRCRVVAGRVGADVVVTVRRESFD